MTDDEPMTPPRAAASSSTHWPLTPPATAIAPGRQCTPLFLPTQGTTSSPSPLPTPTRRFWSLPVPIDVEHGYFDVLAATCNNPLPLAPPVSTTLGESPIPLRPTLLFHAPPVGRQEGREEQHTMPEMRVVLANSSRQGATGTTAVERLSEELEHVDLRPLPAKRPHTPSTTDDDNDDDGDSVTCTGCSFATSNGQGSSMSGKRRRLGHPAVPLSSSTSNSSLREIEVGDTPSPPPPPQHPNPHPYQIRPCESCGCKCGMMGGRGAGSTTLSRGVLGRLLHAMLNSTNALDAMRKADPSINQWADVAQLVGARREDFDRVRHASKWMQDNLGRMKMNGDF